MKHHATTQHYGKLNLDRSLKKPEHLVDALTDHYGLTNIEPPREAVLHFVQYLQLHANAEDLSDMVLAAYHLLDGINELDSRRIEARQARREWQATGINNHANATGEGAELRDRFNSARKRAEDLEEKVAGLSELVTHMLSRHVGLRAKDGELCQSLETRRSALIASRQWVQAFENHYVRVHEEGNDIRWAGEHERLLALWAETVPADYQELVIEGVHAYVAEVDELIRAIDANMTKSSTSAEDKALGVQRLKDLRRLSAHVVDQIDRARQIDDMLAIEARALEELMVAELPGIDDLDAANEVKVIAQTRAHYREGYEKPAPAPVVQAAPAPVAPAPVAPAPAPVVSAAPVVQAAAPAANNDAELAELYELLEAQSAEMEALEKSNKDLKEDLSTLAENGNALEGEIEELHAALRAVEVPEVDPNEEMEALNARLKTAQREKREERALVEAKSEEITDLKVMVTDLERDLRSMKDSDPEAAAEEIAKLQKQNEGLRQALTAAEAASIEHGDESEAREEIERLLDRESELVEAEKHANAHLREAKEKIGELLEELAIIKSASEGVTDDDYLDLQRKVDKLTSRVEEAETDVRAREIDIERLEDEIAQQIADHKDTHRQLKAVAERSAKIEDKLEDKRTLVEELTESISRRDHDLDRVEADLQRRDELLHEHREALRERTTQAQEAEEEAKQLSHEVERRERRVEHLDTMLEERIEENQDLAEALEQRSSQLREVMSQVEHTSGLLKDRNADITRLADALDDAQLEVERFRKISENLQRENDRSGVELRSMAEEVSNRDREISRLYDLVEGSTQIQQDAKREVKRLTDEYRAERERMRSELERLVEREENFERERDALRQRILNDEDQKRQLLDALAQKEEERRFEQNELLQQLREVRRDTSSRNDVLKSLSSRMDEMHSKMESGTWPATERRKKPRVSTEEVRRSSRLESSITEISDMLRRADTAQDTDERYALSREISQRLESLVRETSSSPSKRVQRTDQDRWSE